MIGTELIIKFRGDRAYLTRDRSYSLQEIGLPIGARSFKSPAYWTIKIIGHSEKKLYVEIISYSVGECEFSTTQNELADSLNKIEIIKFYDINTNCLLKTLAGKFTFTILAPRQKNYSEEKEFPKPQFTIISSSENNTVKRPTHQKEPLEQEINETFILPLKSVTFKMGSVSFEIEYIKLNRVLELEIINPVIRAEFDAIKNYFENVLKTKKINVFAKLKLTGDIVEPIEVRSPEIERINNEIIDSVRLEYVRKTIKNTKTVDTEKSIFTLKEYFDTFGDDKSNSNIFYSEEKDFFEDLLKISKTKHYKHLSYLSSKHSHKIMKLRFILSPFSFLFLIEGTRHFHIIWETLDTKEATYVWHIENNRQMLRQEMNKFENIISEIKSQGRTFYLDNHEDNFKRIYHTYSNVEIGFENWKKELEGILT